MEEVHDACLQRSFSSGSQEAESGSQEVEHPEGRTTLSVLCFFQDQGVGFHSLPGQPGCPRLDNCRVLRQTARTDRSEQEGSGDAGPGLGGANCQTA